MTDNNISQITQAVMNGKYAAICTSPPLTFTNVTLLQY